MHIINHIRFLALHLCAQLICPLPLKSPPLGRVLGISDRAVARQTDPKRVGHLLLGSNAHSRQGIMCPRLARRRATSGEQGSSIILRAARSIHAGKTSALVGVERPLTRIISNPSLRGFGLVPIKALVSGNPILQVDLQVGHIVVGDSRG